MRGNATIIETLNTLLTDEIIVMMQSIVHSKLCEKWGYDKLRDKVERRAMDEMRHVKELISRILFLEGIPAVHGMSAMKVGSEVSKQLENDHVADENVIDALRKAISLANESTDIGTRDVLENILKDEDRHIGKIEELQDQITQMTLSGFLSMQVAGSPSVRPNPSDMYQPYTR